MRTWGVLCASMSLAGCPLGLDAPTARPTGVDARVADARARDAEVGSPSDAASGDALDPVNRDAAVATDAPAGAPDALIGDAVASDARADGGPRPDAGCGPCRILQGNGSCAIAPGIPCGGPASCASVVWGPGSVRDGGVGDESCLAAGGMAPLRCSPSGTCDRIDPDECTPGAPIVTCLDARCTDPNHCPRGAPANVPDREAYCVRAVAPEQVQQWVTCDGYYCSDVTKTGLSEEYLTGCDFGGECISGNFSAFCGDYLCDQATQRCASACGQGIESCRAPAYCNLSSGLCVQ